MLNLWGFWSNPLALSRENGKPVSFCERRGDRGERNRTPVVRVPAAKRRATASASGAEPRGVSSRPAELRAENPTAPPQQKASRIANIPLGAYAPPMERLGGRCPHNTLAPRGAARAVTHRFATFAACEPSQQLAPLSMDDREPRTARFDRPRIAALIQGAGRENLSGAFPTFADFLQLSPIFRLTFTHLSHAKKADKSPIHRRFNFEFRWDEKKRNAPPPLPWLRKSPQSTKSPRSCAALGIEPWAGATAGTRIARTAASDSAASGPKPPNEMDTYDDSRSTTCRTPTSWGAPAPANGGRHVV